MTKQEHYQQLIPAHCYYQTIEDHAQALMWCWSLLSDIDNGKTQARLPNECGMCECNQDVTPEERNEYNSKVKVWKVISE